MANLPSHTYVYSVPGSSGMKRPLPAEWYMLRQKGDWRGYLALLDSGAIEANAFFRGLVRSYASSVESFANVQPVGEGLLLATSVWGVAYLGRFLTLCLPSLLEEKNITALKANKARLFIHTDDEGREVILNHPVIHEFIRQGIEVQMLMLSEDVLLHMPERTDNKYWHLGMTQSVDLQYAKALGCDYHLMMPDVVYSAGYFERLLALKKPIITHGCLSIDEAPLNLDAYRNGFSLTVPAGQLMSLGLLHAHPRANYHYVRQAGCWPKSHLLIFEGRDKVRIMSPHQSIAFLEKEIIANLSDRFFFTLDSELEKIAGDTPIYTPCIADALVMSEISGKEEIYARGETQDVKEFCIRFRQRIPEKELDKLFLQVMEFPVEREMLGDRLYLLDDEIDAMRCEVVNNLNA